MWANVHIIYHDDWRTESYCATESRGPCLYLSARPDSGHESNVKFSMSSKHLLDCRSIWHEQHLNGSWHVADTTRRNPCSLRAQLWGVWFETTTTETQDESRSHCTEVRTRFTQVPRQWVSKFRVWWEKTHLQSNKGMRAIKQQLFEYQWLREFWYKRIFCNFPLSCTSAFTTKYKRLTDLANTGESRLHWPEWGLVKFF